MFEQEGSSRIVRKIVQSVGAVGIASAAVAFSLTGSIDTSTQVVESAMTIQAADAVFRVPVGQ